MPKASLFNGRDSVDVYGACKDVSALGANVAVTDTHALLLFASANCSRAARYGVVFPSTDPVPLDNLGFVPNSAQILTY